MASDALLVLAGFAGGWTLGCTAGYWYWRRRYRRKLRLAQGVQP